MGVHGKDVEIRKLCDIPEDEPVFVLRAQDQFASDALQHYWALVFRSDDPSTEFADGVGQSLKEFQEFRQENPDRMKVPD